MGTAVVKHTFVNPIADDPGEVGTKPSHWNATHTVESVTVQIADISDATAAGKALLDDANAAAQRTTLELGSAALAATTDFDAAGAAAAVAASLGSAAYQPATAFDPAGAAAAVSASLAAVAISGSASDLVSGTLPSAQLPAIGTAQLGGDITAAGKAILDDANAASQRTTLGLAAVAASGSASDLGTGTLPIARVGDGTVTLAKLANLTTQRVVGRNTAGAGAPQEVTASQIFDWVSNVNGVLLTRIAPGGWAAAANVGIDGDGDLLLSTNTNPTTPVSGKAKVYAADLASRPTPTWVGASGVINPIQPLFGVKAISLFIPSAGAATMTSIGVNAVGTGTATARPPSSTNFFTAARRNGYVATGATAGLRYGATFLWRGDAAGLGGFHVVWRFGWSDAALVAGARGFVGIAAGVGAPTDVDPSTLTNLIGVGMNNGDANMQVYAAGAVAQPRTDLGANFPANTVTTDFYEFHLYAPPNGAAVGYRLVRLNTGHVATGTIAANLPSSSTFMGVQAWRSNGGAGTVAIDIGGLYVESDN